MSTRLPTVVSKTKERAELNDLVAQFLERGGKIQPQPPRTFSPESPTKGWNRRGRPPIQPANAVTRILRVRRTNKRSGKPRKVNSSVKVLAAVAIRINLAEDAGGPKAPEVVETTGYLEWGGQTNGSSGSSGGLCSVVAGAYCLRASSNNCML